MLHWEWSQHVLPPRLQDGRASARSSDARRGISRPISRKLRAESDCYALSDFVGVGAIDLVTAERDDRGNASSRHDADGSSARAVLRMDQFRLERPDLTSDLYAERKHIA